MGNDCGKLVPTMCFRILITAVCFQHRMYKQSKPECVSNHIWHLIIKFLYCKGQVILTPQILVVEFCCGLIFTSWLFTSVNDIPMHTLLLVTKYGFVMSQNKMVWWWCGDFVQGTIGRDIGSL